jgi:hypothetical protein
MGIEKPVFARCWHPHVCPERTCGLRPALPVASFSWQAAEIVRVTLAPPTPNRYPRHFIDSPLSYNHCLCVPDTSDLLFRIVWKLIYRCVFQWLRAFGNFSHGRRKAIYAWNFQRFHWSRTSISAPQKYTKVCVAVIYSSLDIFLAPVGLKKIL